MTVVLTAALLLPMANHTQTEFDQWQSDWLDRVEAEGWVLSMDLSHEWADMHARHPEIFDTGTVAVLPAREAVAPPPEPPMDTGMGSNVEQWRSLVAAYFPADQVDTALRIMACESGGNPNAYNPSGASGLMQVLASWADNFGYTPQQLFDPAINLHVASILYFDGGWSHWVCRG